MKILKTTVSFLLLFILFFHPATAQDTSNNKFGKGLQLVTKDSSFSTKFSARFQTLYQGDLNLATEDYQDGLQIRRARLKFNGFAYSPNFEYKIELAIANSDTRAGAVPQSSRTASVVLDAVVKWNFKPNWSLWFGQTKLPGNRERVISSQSLQFVDRSNVNSRFNIDRDMGFQLHYNSNKFNFASALSMGEGRNITQDNIGGYDYTARVEYLPFGQFTSKGDYFGSDLMREPKPKLSIGITYDYDERATRSGGQLGEFLDIQRDLSTVFIDAHFKYNGWSSLFEYAHKTSPDGNPTYVNSDDEFKAFYVGQGFTEQVGYLFKNNFEVAGRYTVVIPEEITQREKNTQFTLGISKYISGHNLKVQSDITLIEEKNSDDILMYRFQVELAF
jgi:phosphate-selective porin OprO and OprP